MIHVDKIASSTVRLNIPATVETTEIPDPKIGDVVVVRTLTDNAGYNQLELTNGRLARIKIQDVIVGTLGRRQALKGFVGELPERLELGDRLNILNLGGVIGRCTGRYRELGEPIRVELLGAVVKDGRILNIADHALPMTNELQNRVPIIMVAGSSMNSGKTQAASELVKFFTRGGYKVAAAKLSGVACLRDTLNMEDHGAIKTLSFQDCGYPSTVGIDDVSPLARSIITHLNEAHPDLIVVEMGDGILGGYRVESIFKDKEFMKFCVGLVYCTTDYVGVWGGIHLLRQMGVSIDVVSGPTTDSKMATSYIEREFGVPAANAISSGQEIYDLIRKKVDNWNNPEP